MDDKIRKSFMKCPNCILNKDGVLECKKTHKRCNLLKCPYNKDEYEDNYGLND